MMALFSLVRRNLALRIMLVYVSLILLMTVAGVLVLRRFVRHDLEDATRREIRGAMERLEVDLRQIRQEVLLMAQLSSRASHVQEQRPDIGTSTLQITLVEESRARGIEIAEFSAADASKPPWGILKRALSGMPTVDYILRGEGPGRLHLMAAAPIGSAGRPRRVSVASVSVGRDFLRRERSYLGGDVSLFVQGEMIASSDACLVCLDGLRTTLFTERHWRLLESGKPLYFGIDCRSDPRAVVAFPVTTFDGKTVAFTVSRSRAGEYKAFYHTTLAIAGGSVLFALAMAAAFFLLMSRAIRPLKELTRLSVGISEGRYGETVPEKGEDEVAELAKAFNRMSVSLKEAVREISDWNRLLERRVEEKTQELERIHRRMIEVEKLAAMGQLAAGVAHEINNPLSGILGYSEIALELYAQKPPGDFTSEEVARMMTYFGHIEGLSQRCRAIILDMLKFARHHQEEDVDLCLNEIIRETLAFLGKQLSRNGVAVAEDFAGGLPPVKGNSLQLQQVFTNLILNAAQAMPRGGTLTVRTRREAAAVEAEFADTGVGIEPDHLHRIFEPFFTTKPVGEGTGLGLSVSYGIIKRHGGEIRVASEPGQGSVFTVIFPSVEAVV